MPCSDALHLNLLSHSPVNSPFSLVKLPHRSVAFFLQSRGFLHEAQPGKNSLAYDMQEPFRLLIDLAIIDLVENDTMEKKDFVRTESFTLS